MTPTVTPGSRRLVVLVALAFALALAAFPAAGRRTEAAASAGQPAVASSTTRGVELLVRVPRKSYARNSLVEAHLLIVNRSRSAIEVPGYPENCASQNPGVTVTDASGRQLYPPGVPNLSAPPCAPPSSVSLAPEQEAAATVYAIARGPRLRGTLSVGAYGDPQGFIVATTPLYLIFGSRPAAGITLHTTSSGVYAVVHRPPGAHGPLLYEADNTCPPGSEAETGNESLLWAQATRTRLRPTCAFPQRWEVIAGWVGFPVTELHYVAP